MIPRTFPSQLVSGERAMTVAIITPTGSQKAWIDYIPIKSVAAGATKRNTYATDGAAACAVIAAAGQAWVDYIPVAIVDSATVPWSTNADGFMPMEAVSGSLSTFSPDALNSADSSTGIILSGSDLVATSDGTIGTYAAVRSVNGVSSPAFGESDVIYCFEVVFTDVGSTALQIVGVGDQAVNKAAGPQDDASFMGFRRNTSNAFQKASSSFSYTNVTGATANEGDIFGFRLEAKALASGGATTGTFNLRIFQNGTEVLDSGPASLGLTHDLPVADKMHILLSFLLAGGGANSVIYTVRTDPSDMTYYANYTADTGWSAP